MFRDDMSSPAAAAAAAVVLQGTRGTLPKSGLELGPTIARSSELCNADLRSLIKPTL